MTNDERPWEPPFDGTEVEHLLGALDRQRATFLWKADGLDSDGLGFRTGVSALTLGGLLMHLALVEDVHSGFKLAGGPPGPPWEDVDWQSVEPDWEFAAAAEKSPAELYALYDGAVARARERYAAAIEERGLDGAAALTGPDDERVSVRRLLFDLLEEYGRHTGHADLLRESVDGRIGEDPPDGWRPVGAPA